MLAQEGTKYRQCLSPQRERHAEGKNLQVWLGLEPPGATEQSTSTAPSLLPRVPMGLRVPFGKSPQNLPEYFACLPVSQEKGDPLVQRCCCKWPRPLQEIGSCHTFPNPFAYIKTIIVDKALMANGRPARYASPALAA